MPKETIKQFCPVCCETTEWTIEHELCHYENYKIEHALVCSGCGYSVQDEEWGDILEWADSKIMQLGFLKNSD